MTQAWDDSGRQCNDVKYPLRVHESFAHFYLLIQAAKCGLGRRGDAVRLVDWLVDELRSSEQDPTVMSR